MTLYVVCDIEADGPIPGDYSMLSLGAVAVNKGKFIIDEFYINLKRLPKSKQHPITKKWLLKNCRQLMNLSYEDKIEPKKAINQFGNWLLNLPSPRVMASHPGGWDYMWINWYMHKFLQKKIKRPPSSYPYFSSDGQGVFCIKTFSTTVLRKNYTSINMKKYPIKLFNRNKHTHNALDDAREYANLLIKVLNK